MGFIVGTEKNELENILLMNNRAAVTLSDLKKIQAKTVKPKVSIIISSSFIEGKFLPCATMLRLFLWVLNIIEGII